MFDSLAFVPSLSNERLVLLEPLAIVNGADVETDFGSPHPIGKMPR